jgi:hypothetical protein
MSETFSSGNANVPLKATVPLKGRGILLVAAACASIVLLAFHPGDSATDFVGVLRNEAADQRANAIVHGGFVVLLAIEFVCLAALSMRLGLARAAVVAGLTFFAAGAAAFAASLLIDGLAIPAIAVKYLAAPAAKLDNAKALFILCGALIQSLQPVGILFQWAAVACWSVVLVRMKSRLTGVLGLLLAASIAAMFLLPLAIPSLSFLGGATILIAGLLGQALWLAAVGVGMIRQSD